jgi:metal-sulfur cluster biosynthetic enzyme
LFRPPSFGVRIRIATRKETNPIRRGKSVVNLVNEEIVRESLKDILDPELGCNIVDLGLIYDIDIKDGDVRVAFTLTAMGCPIAPMIAEQIRQTVMALPGVKSVNAELTFSPPWAPSMMSEEVREELGF